MDVRHRFVIELLRPDGTPLGSTTLEPDWEPAVEWTRLMGLRTLRVWAPESGAERAIEPIWHPDLGEPYLRGFRVLFAATGGATWFEEFPVRYFGAYVRSAAKQLLADGRLTTDETFVYRALAYEHTGAATYSEAAFAIDDRHPSLRFQEAPRAALLVRSAPSGESYDGDFEVFLPDSVLHEATSLTREAGEIETGGVLIGHLGHDALPDIWAEITALIPARHTVGDTRKLTFTTDTWTDVRQAIALRGRHELALGWFHSHPQFAWCRERKCSVEAQRQCSAAAGFLSADDVALHRTMFARAFSVALLMTHSINGIVPRLYGWRSGSLEPRGYRVLAESSSTVETRDVNAAVV
jgi:hypothetical protein